MARLFKKRKEKKQAEEAARKQSIQDLKLKNQAKRAAKKADMAALGKAKRADMAAKSEARKAAAPSRVTVDGKTYRDQAAVDMAMERKKLKAESETTKRGLKNIKARREAKVGETYQRTEATGKVSVKRKSDPSKKNQPKPVNQESSSNVKSDKKEFGKHSISKYGSKGKQTFRSKPGESLEDFKKRINPKLKHGGALAIMIAPVKSKEMKAIKKGAKAEKGASLKEVPSKAKGLSKLPKEVRNKMGYAKYGSKVKAMYGAKMKKKAMYGAKMKKK